MAQRSEIYEKEAKACELIVSQLQSDRLIRVIIGQGDDAQTFNIQQILLESLSEYFVNALKHTTMGPQEDSGTLRFPDDELEAWKILLYWMIRREFPRAMLQDTEVLVGCYILGDCYGITRFQDEAMLSLLEQMDGGYLPKEAITKAFKGTPPGSKLRLAVAEAIVMYLDVGDRYKHSDIDLMLNGLNFAEDLLGAQSQYTRRATVDRQNWKPRYRFGCLSKKISPSWQRYMAGTQFPRFPEEIERWLEDC